MNGEKVDLSANQKYAGKKVAFRNKKEFRDKKDQVYNLKEIFGFYNAAYHIYQNIAFQKADAVISPLRGSEPIIRAVGLIASLEQKSGLIPKIHYPRIGQINYSNAKRRGVVASVDPDFASSVESGMHAQKQEMQKIVEGMISSFAQKKGQRRMVITLIDEVFSGGSLSKNVALIEEALQEVLAKRRLLGQSQPRVYLNVIAVANKDTPRCREYQSIKSRGILREYVVPKLFTTDSPRFLFPLIKKRPGFMQRMMRVEKRPDVVVTRKGMEGRDMLFSDIEALHALRQHDGAITFEKVARIVGNGHVKGVPHQTELFTEKSMHRSYLGRSKHITRLSRFRH